MTCSQSCSRLCGSSPVVGSSRNSTSGSPTRAQATASRCFWPPESLPTRAFALLFERRAGRAPRPGPARRGRTSGTGARSRATVSFSVSCVSWSEMPSRSRSAAASRAQVVPRISTSPASALGEPFEDLDRRGLARAVGTEQAEALAAPHFEVEAVDGDHVRVALDQPAAADGDLGGGGSRRGGRRWVRSHLVHSSSTWLAVQAPRILTGLVRICVSHSPPALPAPSSPRRKPSNGTG